MPATASFSNSAALTILASGGAATYPSSVSVSGLTGQLISRVSVQLHGLSHAYPQDVDILLVGPTGRNVVLMSDVGGTSSATANLTFADSGAGMSDTSLTSGTFRPTNTNLTDAFPGPAPARSGALSLATFNGTAPNGTWQLFVYDDSSLNGGGSIAGGWTLTLETSTTYDNVAPMAPALPLNTGEDTAVGGNVLTGAADPDGTPLKATFTAPPAAQGSLVSNPDGTFTFTPAADFNGSTTFSYTVSAKTPQTKLLAGDTTPGDQFGWAVALDGDTAVVSAFWLDLDTLNFMQPSYVYIFVRTPTGWQQQQQLSDPVGAGSDFDGAGFGAAVALEGDTLVVGSPADDDLSGSVYVYTRSGTTWTQQAWVYATDWTAYDLYGAAVALSGDVLVVGAPNDGHTEFIGIPNFDGSGSAYVYRRQGNTWVQQKKLLASDGVAEDRFGSRVAADGNTVVVTSPFHDAGGADAGAAYVFVENGRDWSQQAKLTAGDAAADDQFGSAVALAGDTVVVGAVGDDHTLGIYGGGEDAGAAYVFTRSGVSWSQQAKLTAGDAYAFDQFGAAVAISGDTVVVGAPGYDKAAGGGGWIDNSGGAYVFQRSGSVWSQTGLHTANDAAAADEFGFAAAVDGDTLLFGAHLDDSPGGDAGSAYIQEIGGATGIVTVNVSAVNDAPQFTAADPPPIAVSAGPQTVAGWASGIRRGPATATDESGQGLTFSVTLLDVTGDLAFNVSPTVNAVTGNLSYTVAAGTQGMATFRVTLADNGSGTAPHVNSLSREFTLVVNEAPLLDASGTPTLTPIARDSQPTGQTVASFLGAAISDTGTAAVEGIAVIALTGNGTWQFSLDGGASWTAFGTVSSSAARLLRDGDLVRFVPTAGFTGVATLTAHAWDQTAGQAGDSFDVTAAGTGGAAAFSINTETATLRVGRLLTPVAEDSRVHAGDTVASFSATFISDADPLPRSGVAVVGVTGTENGAWQFSLNGGRTWLPLGSPNEAAACLLRGTDRIRFVPAAHFHGDVSLRFRAWDQTSGGAGGTANLALTGGGTAFSAAADTVFVRVTPVNDRPLLDSGGEPPLPPAGTTVASLLGASMTDVDAGAMQGIGVVTAGVGWEYKVGAGLWTPIGPLPVGKALLLGPSDQLRFVPPTGFTGVARISYRAWDQTAGSAGDTPATVVSLGTALSLATETATARIPAANNAPNLTAAVSPAVLTITEDLPILAGHRVGDLIGSTLTDDPGALRGIVVTGQTGSGTWQYSLTNGRTWLPAGVLSTASALLLRDSDKVRFLPAANSNGAASLSYRGWDRTRGSVGARANLDAGGSGGATPFSTQTQVANLTITLANDRPVLNVAFNPTLAPVAPGTLEPAGDLVSDLLGTAASDVDGDTPGLAVVTAGVGWQYQAGAGAWTPVSPLPPGKALLLGPADRLRFVPPTGFTGVARIGYRAWDQTAGSAGGTPATVVSLGTALSLATETATITVNAVNDRPVLNIAGNPLLTPVLVDDTDPLGDTVATLLGAWVTDADRDSVGIAVTSLTTPPGGDWQYRLASGGGWVTFTVTPGTALLLGANDRLRFLPAAGFRGTARVTYRARDDSVGSAGDPFALGSLGTSLSLATETALVVVNSVPVLDVS